MYKRKNSHDDESNKKKNKDEPRDENLIVNCKISDKKILKLRKFNENSTKNDEIQVLHFEECSNLDEARERIVKFNFNDVPKTFVIIISFMNEFEEDTEELEKAILDKFSDNRPLLLQLRSADYSTFYYKHRDMDSLDEMNLNLSEARLKVKLEKRGLSWDVLIMLLKNSILDADFSLLRRNFKEILPSTLAGDELCLRLINLFNIKHSEKIQAEILFSIIRTKKFGMFLAFFNVFDESNVEESRLEKILDEKCINNSQNAFLVAIECKNLEVSKCLLNFYIKLPHLFTINLFKLALNKIKRHEFFELFNEFKKINFQLSPDQEKFKYDLMLEVEKILIDIIKLHENIEAENVNEIRKFAEKYQELRLCHGNAKVCALNFSIECKKFEIYALLRSLGFYTDNSEEFHREIQKLSDNEKEKIRDENLKHVVSNPEAFIGIILSKCTFDSQSPIASSDVREMLLKFKEIDEINAMFPTLAHAEMQINFDYRNKTVHVMDPTKNNSVLGLAYHLLGLLYIGLNDNKNQQYGTIAHELTHLMLHLIYENDCLPYCEGDTDKEVEFLRIVEETRKYCENNFTSEEIVKRVFDDYDESKYIVEAAVRVNEMLGSYHDNQAKIKELVHQHPELFKFNREKVLPDFKIPNVYRMIKLNNEFGLIKKTCESDLQVKRTKNSEILTLLTAKKVLLVTNVPQLMLSKIYNEVKGLPGNKLNLKTKNLFVDLKMLEQKHTKEEFKNLIASSDLDRVIIGSQYLQEMDVELFHGDFSCYCVVSKIDESLSDVLTKTFHFERVELDIKWHELTDQSQEFLLNATIRFQNKNYKVSEIFDDVQTSITPEVLEVLCLNDNIQINRELDDEVKIVKFIPRVIQTRKNKDSDFFESDDLDEGSKDFSIESFLLETQKSNNFLNIVAISDVAGSGKTTLLRKIYETLREKFPLSFIIFVSLIDYVDELSEDVDNTDFAEFIVKILKFNALEKKIFMQKYVKGEIKILFDAFDEISPNCKENTLKIFKLFETHGTNQMFITTRTHLESDLETQLNISIYMLKILTRKEQIQFLVETWGNLDGAMVDKCANLLVDKIRLVLMLKSNIIGLPLIIQGLANAFKDKINEKFEKVIEHLDISSIYEKIIETYLQILVSRFPENLVENQKKSLGLIQAHQFFSIAHLFIEKFANSLGLYHDEDDWPMEEIARCGLIKYNKNGKSQFNHETIAENFTALFLFNLIKNVRKLSVFQIEFLVKILTTAKFKVVRMFLDSMLERVKDVQNLKIFSSSDKICKVIKKNKGFFELCVRENLFCVFELFVLLIKDDKKLFKEVIEFNHRMGTYLMQILPKASNVEKFESFFNAICRFYFDNLTCEFLLKRNKYGLTVLHYFANHCINEKIFEIAWKKIKVYPDDEEALRSFVLLKGGQHKQNALLLAIAIQNEISFKFLFENIFCRIFELKQFIYETDKHSQNLLHHLSFRGSVAMFERVINKLKSNLSKEDFKDFLKTKNGISNNFLHLAASLNRNENSIAYLLNLIESELEEEELRVMLSEVDRWYSINPLQVVINRSNARIFTIFFAFYLKHFTKDEIKIFAENRVNRMDVFALCKHNMTNGNEMLEVVTKTLEAEGIEIQSD